MIEREERDGVVTLRMAHGKVSALDVELVGALARHVAALDAPDVRAVVLTGTGSSFSAGVDLFRVLDGGADYVREFLPGLVAAVRALFVVPKPVVAAINGHAIAGGCVLAAACDYRVMARGGGRIGVPELRVGVPFPAAAIEAVRFAVPPERLQEIVYTGGTYPPDEALAKGLVDELADDAAALAARAFEVASDFAAVPPAAFAHTKRYLRRDALARMDAAGETDAEATRAVWSDPATHEHIRAYLARVIGKGPATGAK